MKGRERIFEAFSVFTTASYGNVKKVFKDVNDQIHKFFIRC